MERTQQFKRPSLLRKVKLKEGFAGNRSGLGRIKK